MFALWNQSGVFILRSIAHINLFVWRISGLRYSHVLSPFVSMQGKYKQVLLKCLSNSFFFNQMFLNLNEYIEPRTLCVTTRRQAKSATIDLQIQSWHYYWQCTQTNKNPQYELTVVFQFYYIYYYYLFPAFLWFIRESSFCSYV